MRFLALPNELGGWSALCLDHDYADDGATAEEALENCRLAVKGVKEFISDNPQHTIMGPPSDEVIREWFQDAPITHNTTNAFYLLDFTEEAHDTAL